LTESNRFVWPGPDLRSVDTEIGYYGPLPPALFTQGKQRFVAIAGGGEDDASKRAAHGVRSPAWPETSHSVIRPRDEPRIFN